MSDMTVRSTFLFTDVEGSTAIWESVPDEMSRALARHDRLLRAAVEEAGGSVVKTVGDGFHAVFASPSAALCAAIAGQRELGRTRWPVGAELRVRMAIHTGTAVHRDADYFGPSLNRVARLLAIAHGGQVLLSGSTAALVADDLPADVTLDDLGQHHLKDIAGTERVHQLSAPGLRQTFPPLRSPPDPRRRHNLPDPVSSFVGRRHELIRLQTLAAEGRLLSLVGPGGVGKTRLALEVAARAVDRFDDGVRIVGLESVTNRTTLLEAVASTLGTDPTAAQASRTSVAQAVAGRSMLVLFDHCEQVIAEVAALVAEVLAHAPELRVITTSRSPLHLEGEVVFRVPPMALPRVGFEGDDEVADAVALFLSRARANDPELVLDSVTRSTAASICRRLDGLPLAIELAAARLRSMSLAELDTRLDPMSRTDPTTSPHTRTLTDAICWSIDLLGRDERRMLERLSVFGGSWSLTTAEAVVGLDDLDPAAVVDLHAALCDRSLVQVSRSASGTRYTLLGAVRDVAARGMRTDQPEYTDRLAANHARAFAAIAASVRARGRYRRLTRTERDALDTDRDNFWAAASRSAAAGQRSDGVAIALILDRLVAGGDRRLVALLEDLVTGPSELAPGLAADAHLALADQLRFVDREGRRTHLEAAVTIARAHDDTAALVLALTEFAEYELQRDGGLGLARALADEAVGLAREGEEEAVELRSLVVRAEAHRMADDREAASIDLRDALAIAQQLDDTASAGEILLSLATAEHAEAHPEESTWLATDAIALSEEAADERLGGWARSLLGVLAADHGDTTSARRLHLAALDLASILGDRTLAAAAVFGLARAAADDGDWEHSSTLLGAGDALLETATAHLHRPYADDRQRAWRSATERLGAIRMRVFVDRGRAMPLDAIIGSEFDSTR
jgi:predicted ATPase/class 3 adenylate cyclase